MQVVDPGDIHQHLEPQPLGVAQRATDREQRRRRDLVGELVRERGQAPHAVFQLRVDLACESCNALAHLSNHLMYVYLAIAPVRAIFFCNCTMP